MIQFFRREAKRTDSTAVSGNPVVRTRTNLHWLKRPAFFASSMAAPGTVSMVAGSEVPMKLRIIPAQVLRKELVMKYE